MTSHRIEPKKVPIYGPGPPQAGYPEAYYVPKPHYGIDVEFLYTHGQAFKREDLPTAATAHDDFVNDGIVSTRRSMVLLFCDLKDSTRALKKLGTTGFHALQCDFFERCRTCAIELRATDAQGNGHTNFPRPVIDKFMGDGALIYFDCGEPDWKKAEERVSLGARMAVGFMMRLSAATLNLAGAESSPDLQLGIRFGIAATRDAVLSIMGCSRSENREIGDLTVTGEAVNLAARLEHASAADFLASIGQERDRLNKYAAGVDSADRLRGTELGAALSICDQQVIDLYRVCRTRIEVRADAKFRAALESGTGPRFEWAPVPFSPRGFSATTEAYLLGGNEPSDVFRPV